MSTRPAIQIVRENQSQKVTIGGSSGSAFIRPTPTPAAAPQPGIMKLGPPAAKGPDNSRNPPATARAPSPLPVTAKGKAVCEKYEEIKRNFKQTKKLWCDADFPADIKSVYPSTAERKIDWKRPKEICPTAKLFADGVSRFDVRQGELGDCWVLAAVASLSMHKALFDTVVPDDQDFEENYCGAFRFRFWKFGEWVDVIVDDRLPVDKKELLFMHSADTDEFWSALLEKAYAKLNGCYENLVGGVQAEALEDFTGGLCEVITLKDWQESKSVDHFEQMLRYVKMSSLMGCSIDAEDDEVEEALPNGLLMGHAYTITDVREIPVKGQTKQLVRVRNPWGDSTEWNGAWSDGSREWKDLTEADRKKHDITFDDDGEFWMSFEDFVKNFTKLEVCHLGLESLGDPTMTMSKKKKTRWESVTHHGAWKKNVNAGGCRNNITTFWTNPQYVVDVVDPDEDDDEDKGHVLIGLMQKDMRMKHMDFWTIGYSIYKLPANHAGTLDQKFFRVTKMADKSPQYINQREIVGRHKLDPGKYAIVPTTFAQNEEADFMLRIFSEKPSDVNELDMANTMVEVQALVIPANKVSEEESRLAKLKEEFRRLSGPTEAINANQLRDILNAALRSEVSNFNGFNTEVCRSMLALMDADMSGKMCFEEFSHLWKNLLVWKKVFKDHDEDNSGTFDAFELRNALNATGFKVSNRVFACLANRYADPDKGTISFEDFILMVTRLRNSFETFKTHGSKEIKGSATFSEEHFLALSLYV
jgi:calpain, invertebrate